MLNKMLKKMCHFQRSKGDRHEDEINMCESKEAHRNSKKRRTC